MEEQHKDEPIIYFLHRKLIGEVTYNVGMREDVFTDTIKKSLPTLIYGDKQYYTKTLYGGISKETSKFEKSLCEKSFNSDGYCFLTDVGIDEIHKTFDLEDEYKEFLSYAKDGVLSFEKLAEATEIIESNSSYENNTTDKGIMFCFEKISDSKLHYFLCVSEDEFIDKEKAHKRSFSRKIFYDKLYLLFFLHEFETIYYVIEDVIKPNFEKCNTYFLNLSEAENLTSTFSDVVTDVIDLTKREFNLQSIPFNFDMQKNHNIDCSEIMMTENNKSLSNEIIPVSAIEHDSNIIKELIENNQKMSTQLTSKTHVKIIKRDLSDYVYCIFLKASCLTSIPKEKSYDFFDNTGNRYLVFEIIRFKNHEEIGFNVNFPNNGLPPYGDIYLVSESEEKFIQEKFNISNNLGEMIKNSINQITTNQTKSLEENNFGNTIKTYVSTVPNEKITPLKPTDKQPINTDSPFTKDIFTKYLTQIDGKGICYCIAINIKKLNKKPLISNDMVMEDFDGEIYNIYIIESNINYVDFVSNDTRNHTNKMFLTDEQAHIIATKYDLYKKIVDLAANLKQKNDDSNQHQQNNEIMTASDINKNILIRLQIFLSKNDELTFELIYDFLASEYVENIFDVSEALFLLFFESNKTDKISIYNIIKSNLK